MEERAKVRFEEEMAEHQEKLETRKAKEKATSKKPIKKASQTRLEASKH
jgi:hypothetical protein